MSPSIRARGVHEAASTMRAAEDALELDTETTDAGRLAGGSIRPLVPVRTGALLGSLVEERSRVGEVKSAGLVSDSDHVLPVHYGTVHMEAQPFGVEGLERVRLSVTELYLRGIERALDLVKGA